MTTTRSLVCVLTLVASSTHVAAVAPPEKPNFVIILADDLGYNDLGCFGSAKIKTPHLDRMAREGLRLTSFYAQPLCGPSRAALMTGCYPMRVAEPGNRKHNHTVLHPKELTLAEVLKPAGYATACIGKWHLCPETAKVDDSTMPNAQGFDVFFGTPLYNGVSVKVADVPFRSALVRNHTVVTEAVQSWDDITQEYTRAASQFLHQHKDRPFFLYLAHSMPHIPLGASKAFRGKSTYGPYGDAVEELDWSVGEVLNTLRKLGLEERTLVLFLSDNGPWIETTRGNVPGGKPYIPVEHAGRAEPLRSYKMLTWEGGVRVPCIARWPGHVPAGTTSDEVTATIDLLPTLAKLAGASLPADRVIDGKDLGPLLVKPSASRSPHEAFFYYNYTHLQAVRSGRWKLVLPRPEHAPWTGFARRMHKDGVMERELYDLRADVGETKNVAAQHPNEVQRLLKLIERGRADLGDYDRIGAGQRFFEDGPKRPDMDDWKKQ